MALCTQGDVEKFLQIDVSAEPDAAVTMLIENGEALIKTYLDRDVLESATVTAETLDPPLRYERLYLREWPVTAVASLTEEGTALVEDTDYVVLARYGTLYRTTSSGTLKNWKWRKPQSIVTTYTAGYAADSRELHALRDVCTRVVARCFQAASAYANAPAGASAIRSVGLQGSDNVSYKGSAEKDALVDVTSVAVQLTDQDKAALTPYTRQWTP